MESLREKEISGERPPRIAARLARVTRTIPRFLRLRRGSFAILGKQVIISEYMPDIETGTKPIAFGDFSYYWIVGRKPVTVRTLLEKFVLYDQIGYLAFEFLDGKIVRNEAIKVIQMADAGK